MVRRVHEQVRDDLLEPRPVALGDEPRRDVHLERVPRAREHLSQPLGDAAREVRQVDARNARAFALRTSSARRSTSTAAVRDEAATSASAAAA
ncbi:MAG TPA: hypothetical protein VF894_12600, partial [Anaeromyxobacter sp.]